MKSSRVDDVFQSGHTDKLTSLILNYYFASAVFLLDDE